MSTNIFIGYKALPVKEQILQIALYSIAFKLSDYIAEPATQFIRSYYPETSPSSEINLYCPDLPYIGHNSHFNETILIES